MNPRTLILTAATSLALIAPANSFAFTPASYGGGADQPSGYLGGPTLRDMPGATKQLRHASSATNIAPEGAFRYQALRNTI